MGSETRKKTKRILVRVTTNEHASIQKLSNICNLSLPEYMRRMSLTFTPTESESRHDFERLETISGQLNEQGQKLKRFLDDGDSSPEPDFDRIRQLIYQLNQIASSLKKCD